MASNEEVANESEFDGRPELIKKRARAELFQRLVNAAIGTFVIVSLALLIVNAFQATQTRTRLLECTVPGRSCYNESQQRTGQLVQQLIDENSKEQETTRKIVILAAACSQSINQQLVDGARVIAIEACVNKELNRLKDLRTNNATN